MKKRKIVVHYKVEITEQEFKALVALGSEWGLDFDKAKPLKIAKRALRNSGESGCMSKIPQPVF